MKHMTLLTLIISCILCDALVDSQMSEHARIKRWEKGSMNMQANIGTSDLSNMFRGTAGVDYPDLKTIPNTNFRCEDQVYEGGLYADVETSCQVYHVCHDGRKDSFLCGKGTIFNQQILACDYWYSAECETAPNYYYVNSQIGNSVSPNNLQDNYSKNGGNHQQIAGDNRRLPNTGVNAYGPNQQQNPGRTGDNRRLPNTGVNNAHNQQQPIPGSAGDNRRLPNTGVNNAHNQQQPIPGRAGDNRRLPNTGVNNAHNQQQPIPGSTGDNRRLPNTGVNDYRGNQHQPIAGSTGDNRRISNTGVNQDNLNSHNQQQGIPGNTGDNRRAPNSGVNVDQYNRHNQQQIPGNTDNRRTPNTGINRDHYNGHTQQCRCIRSINKTPWSFPTGMMQGNDR